MAQRRVDGAVGDSPVWAIDEASLRIAGRVFVANVVKIGVDPKESGLDGVVIGGFSSHDREQAEEVVKTLPPATSVVFELPVNHNATLRRTLRFDLFSAGTGLNLTEVPRFARFDDPEYNDRLDGLAKLDRKDLPDDELDMTFVADRPEVRPSDRIEFAIGLRSRPNETITAEKGFRPW